MRPEEYVRLPLLVMSGDGVACALQRRDKHLRVGPVTMARSTRQHKQTKEPEEKKEGATESAVVGYFFLSIFYFPELFFSPPERVSGEFRGSGESRQAGWTEGQRQSQIDKDE